MKKQENREPLEARVLRFIRDNCLISGQSQLLVAVSGGPDSVCLLHVLVKLREELGIKLHVSHLDHQLRGAESKADADYVQRLANQLKLPVTIDVRDVKGYRAQRHLSLEEAAREVRYAFLAELAESIGADCVAVGHTTDDQVETILMHLIRGTGARGLRGLQPANLWQSSERSLTVIRPLLPVSRQETADYCRSHQLEPRLDASNQSLHPLRNKIRHQLVPLLKSYNPRITEALLRTARLAGEDLASLNQESARLGAGISKRQEAAIVFDKKRFLKLPAGVQRHLLREAAEEILGSLKDIESRHIEEIIAAAGKPAGKTLSLPMGLIFITEYDRFLLAPQSATLSAFPDIHGECLLKIPGKTTFPGWHVTATIIKREQIAKIENDFTAYLCLDNIGDNLSVRSRHPGDIFQPLGMSQPKELAEFMIDAKIPRAWRPRVPIVCSPEHILWVVGWRMDDRAKITDRSKQILCLKFEQC